MLRKETNTGGCRAQHYVEVGGSSPSLRAIFKHNTKRGNKMKKIALLASLLLATTTVFAAKSAELTDSSYYPIKTSIWEYDSSESERPNLEIIFENFQEIEHNVHAMNPYVCSTYPAGYVSMDTTQNWTADYNAQGHVDRESNHISNSCFINGGMYLVDTYYVLTIKYINWLNIEAETAPVMFILRSDHSVEINPAKVIYPATSKQ